MGEGCVFQRNLLQDLPRSNLCSPGSSARSHPLSPHRPTTMAPCSLQTEACASVSALHGPGPSYPSGMISLLPFMSILVVSLSMS